MLIGHEVLAKQVEISRVADGLTGAEAEHSRKPLASKSARKRIEVNGDVFVKKELKRRLRL